MTTIQDVAGDLGLSAMTVSRALNGHPDVKEETRRRVIARATELNYRPNRWARSLVTQRSRIVGAVIPKITYSFFGEIIGGLQTVLEEQGYSLILSNSSEDPERERREIDMLVGSRAEGLVVASVIRHDDPSFFRGLQDEGVPMVLIDRTFEGFEASSATTDDYRVGCLAAEHLIGLGHTRMAHITGAPVSTGEQRRQGFLDTLMAAGIEVPPQYVVEGGGFDVEAGVAGMNRLLKLNPRPTAVFGPSDPASMGAVQTARQAGLRVPEDISIIGAGAIEHDYQPDPFMTTLRWDRRVMGEKAGHMLVRLMAGEDLSHETVVMPPTLIVRRSTAPLKV
jgi:DNA-binding LacI/PurR family transcriptional regulator